MAKIKYQLLKPEGPTVYEGWSLRLPLKVLLACSVIVLIVLYYHWRGPENSILPETFQNGSIISSTSETYTTQIPDDDVLNSTLGISEGHFKSSDEYFVNTTNCRMPAPNPFAPDVLRIFNKVSYKKCDKSDDLITVNYDEKKSVYKLHINKANITCCYKHILRSGVGSQADALYKLLPCSNFHQDFVVPQQVNAAITECRQLNDKKLLQQDAFSFVQPAKILTVNESSTIPSIESRPSVLLWGIDSLSRMNFERNMPLMYKYLRDENWFELRGYNKMGDNTYPNLMAVLTGFNSTRSLAVCKPKKVGGLDACPMLWKHYKDRGYRTGYAEDWSRYATFNYLFKGFQQPPTDYYARPLILAVEKELNKVYDMGIPYCVGRRHFAEYVYDAAIQFTKVHQNQSSFGLFWANSFSHNNFALPSSMDAKILEYMRTLQKDGTLEKSIILFFSDHGMRFGSLRKLESGFLEERMPFVYIWLPHWFRVKYPEFVHHLKLNGNRLTSPYDIHATLRHILELETPQAELPRPEGCPSCHSIFFEVSESRDCKDAGIAEHWCTCLEFEDVPLSEPKARIIAEQLVEATNGYLAKRNLTGICQRLKLSNIESVQLEILPGSKSSDTYLVRYETEPASSLFEASVKWSNSTQRISISVPAISRMTAYKDVAGCVADAVAKKFCICVN